MLLIGDVHINSLQKDKIIRSIEEYILSQKDDKITFFGDFVYHFSYDRKAILDLFALFLRLFSNGKTLYILSGNHDWISDSYIFQEAQSSFNILNKHSNNKIYFITQPEYYEIDGQRCLFLPFNYKLFLNKAKPQIEKNQGIEGVVCDLLASNNKNEVFSGYLNHYLLNEFNNNDQDLIVFHHYYFADRDFPGQFARFRYKDIAISDYFLDNFSNIKFVSGHLHKGFGIDKYFCTSSVWATSPLEQDEFKFFYQIDLKTLEVKAYSADINYYLVYAKQELLNSSDQTLFVTDKKITENDLLIKIRQIWDKTIVNFDNKKFQFDFPEFLMPKLSSINLIIQSDDLDYDKMNEMIDKELINQLKDIKIKKKVPRLDHLYGLLDTSQKDLQQSISDWKNLLRDYLEKKFGDNSDKYIDKLREAGVRK